MAGEIEVETRRDPPRRDCSVPASTDENGIACFKGGCKQPDSGFERARDYLLPRRGRSCDPVSRSGVIDRRVAEAAEENQNKNWP